MIKDILIGIKAYSGSLKLVSELRLWRYFAIPALISLLTTIVIGFSAWALSDNIGAFIAQIWTWETGKAFVNSLANIVGGFSIVVLGLILYKHIVMALSAPFMSPVSEKIEFHLTGEASHDHRNTSFFEQLWRGIRLNLRNLFKELLFTLPILVVGMIPFIALFTIPLLFLVQAYYAGFGNIDYTLERHYKYYESVEFVRKNRGLAIGNGIIFMLFLLIPVIGIIIVLPLSVAAASVQTVKLLKAQNTSLREIE